MEYLAKTKKAILARERAGMSLRRISEIYGGTTDDIAEVVAHERQCNLIADLDDYGDAAHLFNSFSQELKKHAIEVSQKYEVPVTFLFRDASDKHRNKLVRGCFFHGLSVRFDWPYRKIVRVFGKSDTFIRSSIKIYCESVGANGEMA